MRLVACIAAGAALLIVAAGCGGGGSSNGVKGAEKTISPKTQIRQNWVAFFDPSTPASQKVKLLQNGQKFAPVIKAQAGSPLAKKTAATVKSVTLNDASHATVVYTITLAGKPALKNQTGQAVRVNGMWKIGDKSLCGILGLQGMKPPGCTP